MSKQLPDLVIDHQQLDEIISQTIHVPTHKYWLSHSETQAFIHFKALEQYLIDHGISPNFTVELNPDSRSK